MLDVRRLRLLAELSAHGTLAAVAELLHQSPSSVSQQLTQLERDVGAELLRKSGRRVELTPAAQILVEHTQLVLAHLEEAEAAVASLTDNVSGAVHLAAFQSAALAFMPQLLTRLARDYPRLKVTMSQRLPEEALFGARTSVLDLVIAQQYPPPPRRPASGAGPGSADHRPSATGRPPPATHGARSRRWQTLETFPG
ncbi:MAG: LysR family transcriptional regulator [Nocardioides sp.]|uniref:LysR family transcriptional regulator n=1 Tax=Nocardioides sp. TaxID=35761 RepID=UPI0039E5AECA